MNCLATKLTASPSILTLARHSFQTNFPFTNSSKPFYAIISSPTSMNTSLKSCKPSFKPPPTSLSDLCTIFWLSPIIFRNTTPRPSHTGPNFIASSLTLITNSQSFTTTFNPPNLNAPSYLTTFVYHFNLCHYNSLSNSNTFFSRVCFFLILVDCTGVMYIE